MKSAAPVVNSAKQKSLGFKAGEVFRRRDVADKYAAVDRALADAVKTGCVRKARQGLYYVPKQTPFGEAPPNPEDLVGKFLEDDHFLLFNPSSYNALGLGTTQLYNTTVVYNHKRHGKFTLAGFDFDFRDKPRFPTARQVTPEYLLVDLLNNLEELAEDPEALMSTVKTRLPSFDQKRLLQNLKAYGSAKAKRRMARVREADNV